MAKSWSEEETLEAVENASHLSQLLEQPGFFEQKALRWLDAEHIDKFLRAIDAEESVRMMGLASRLHYPGSGDNTHGLPLLEWFWVIGTWRNRGREDLNISMEPGAGRNLIVRLAEFQPKWIARWWQWRCSNGRGQKLELRNLTYEYAVIDALSEAEFKSILPELSDYVVASIVERMPRFVGALEHDGSLLGLILKFSSDQREYMTDLVKLLRQRDLPSDLTRVVDSILDSHGYSISYFDDLSSKWGSTGADPVAFAMANGHDRLCLCFRSLWEQPKNLTGNNFDEKLWVHPLRRGRAGRALASAARAAPELLKLELGFSIGLRLSDNQIEPSAERVGKELEELGIEFQPGTVETLLPMVELWAALRTLATYQAKSWQHETELAGLRARVTSVASAAPDLWAQSLTWILARASKFGDVPEAVTLELSLINSEVRSALEKACSNEAEPIRLKALGLWALLHGLEDPKSGLPRTLADAAAHHMDGTPIFPHPLEATSRTWLGSLGVEQAIANGVRRAATIFASQVRNQGGDEVPLTTALVKEIEFAFRDVQPRLKLFGSGRFRSPTPILSVSYRGTSNQIEEPVYGCDLAWLLNATVRGRYDASWVDLVQVKKTTALQRRGKTTSRADSWRIESKQLGDILKWSATAVYWLIASEGELLVIPAKHLAAIKRGTKGNAQAESFTVGYHEIRSVAISLEQYLVDLLVGQWVGTASDDVLRFARGENSNHRPRAVIEVTISIGQHDQ